MSNTHTLNYQTLYLLSGISASGKSTVINKLIEQGFPKEGVISSDDIRKNLLGSFMTNDQYGIKEILVAWDLESNKIWEIVSSMVQARINQKLPTILDSTLLTESDRSGFVKIAKNNGMNCEVLILDTPLEECKERIKKRKLRFPESVLEEQNKVFNKTSIHPYKLINSNDNFIIKGNNYLNGIEYDIIGDTHGLLNEVKDFLSKKGYSYCDKNGFKHDTKKIIFLGDVLDRGNFSIELLQSIQKTVENNNGYFILGNHEDKLLKNFHKYQTEEIIISKSISSSETFLKFLQLTKEEQNSIICFLKKSPHHLNLSTNKYTIGLCHANNSTYNPDYFPRSFCLYGTSMNSKDSDFEYAKNYELEINKTLLIRGHIPNTSEQNYIYSLDKNQAFDGFLAILDFSKFAKDLDNINPSFLLFENNTTYYKVNYNYDSEIKEKVNMLKTLDDLKIKKLIKDGVRKNKDNQIIIYKELKEGFKVFKHEKSVFYKKLWKEVDPFIEKARGIVLDFAGNIVVHPFNKVYNYGEYESGLSYDKNKEIIYVEKMNGFLGCISKHPWKDELLYTTTGCVDQNGIFNQYIKNFVSQEKEFELIKYLKENPSTLMFEVIHPEDKHIIHYSEKEHGLYLIGVRGLNLHDNILSEEQNDLVANKLKFNRPKWGIMKLHDLLLRMKDCEIEGYMLRDKDSNEYISKLKSNNYLRRKFLSRMNNNDINFLFSKPEIFKQNKVEEEFFEVIDLLVQKTNKNDFLKMTEQERLNLINVIIDDIRLSYHNEKQAKYKI